MLHSDAGVSDYELITVGGSHYLGSRGFIRTVSNGPPCMSESGL
jgi:hypothetical protein